MRLPALFSLLLTPLLSPASDWPSESERVLAYQERCEAILQDVIDRTDPDNPDRGGLFGIAINLAAGTNMEWARARLRAANDPPTGAMFWMHPMVFLMYAGKDNLNDEDWAFIRELWRTYFPYRGDTENHWLMYYASIYLACQMFPDAGPEAWYNGKSSSENMAEAEDYIRDWIRITTSYGQGEYDSPNYIEEYIRPLALLAGWTEDEAFRHLSEMALDYIILDFAVENHYGIYSGAHSRLYPRYTLQPALAAATRHAWLFWGQGEFQNNAGNMILALSGYTPPAILHRIATDRDVAYVQKELKRTRWRIRNVGDEGFEIDFRKTTPVYKYTYMHPDYALGNSQGGLLQPIQQQTWSLIWKVDNPIGVSNTMFGLQPYSNPFEGTMYFGADWDTVTDLIARSKVDYDSPDKLEGGSPYERIYQHTSTLFALYDIPEGSRFPHIITLFSRDLEDREEDKSGWIFARAGPIYIAYYPLVEGEWRPVDWTGLLKGGAGGWFSTNFEELADGSEFYYSPSLKNGYIVQIGSTREFESYQAFKYTIKELDLEVTTDPSPKVRYTAPDGTVLVATYDQPLVVDGKPMEYEDWKLFDGPFTQAERESERIRVQHGEEVNILDFKANTFTSTISTSSDQ